MHKFSYDRELPHMIVNIFCSFLTLLSIRAAIAVACCWLHLHFTSAASSATASRGNKLLLLVLDGVRHDLVDLTKHAQFAFFAARGYQANETWNVSPAKCQPNLMSIATGSLPDNHGVVDQRMEDPLLGDEVYMGEESSRWLDGQGREPIWVTNQRHGHRTGCINWFGAQSSIMGSVPSVTLGASMDDQEMSLAFKLRTAVKWLQEAQNLNLVLVYHDHPGLLATNKGPETQEFVQEMATIDLTLEIVREAMLRDADLHVILTSDHGLTKPASSKISLSDELQMKSSDLDARTKLHSQLAIWPKSTNEDEMLDFLERKIVRNKPGLFLAKKRDNPGRHRRVPPFVLFSNSTQVLRLLKSEQSSIPRSSKAQFSGFSNELTDMHPFLIASGRKFKQGSKEPANFHLVDIYLTICWILRLDQPWLNDGDFDRISPIFEPTPVRANLTEFLQYASGERIPANRVVKTTITPANSTAGATPLAGKNSEQDRSLLAITMVLGVCNIVSAAAIVYLTSKILTDRISARSEA